MKNLILLIACCSALAACGGDAANTNTATNTIANSNANSNPSNSVPAANSNSSPDYPKETVDAFLKSCESAGGDMAFCTCVFGKVQASYSLDEFSAIEDEIQSGEPPKEFVEFSEKARAECEKSGDANVGKND